MSGKEAMNGNGNDSASSKDKEPPKKRIRQPEDEPDVKKKRISHHPKEYRRPSILQLKNTGESFLQDGPCFEVAPKLEKCRECRLIANHRSKVQGNIFCFFYAFRILKYTKTGQFAVTGFSDPINDPFKDDLKVWNFERENLSKDLDVMCDASSIFAMQGG